MSVCRELLNPKLDQDTKHIVIQGKIYSITGYEIVKDDVSNKLTDVKVYAVNFEFDKEALSK